MDAKGTSQNKLRSLDREVRFYKNLISELPYSFSYRDAELGMQLDKGNDQSYSISENGEIRKSELIAFNKKLEDLPFANVETFLEPILDVVPHHIVFIDRNGLVTLCNLQACMDLKKKKEEIVGHHIRELLQIPDEKINLLETLRSEKSIVNREILDRNYGINNTRIIRDSKGEVQRVIGIFQFLNGIKDAEKAALAGRIAAGIAHEIRNPLTTVRGFLQVLQSKSDELTADLFKTLLIPEIDRANKIISDFLRIAKPAEILTEEIKVNEFIYEYLGKFLNSEALLHNIAIEYETDFDVIECSFEANREELLQVFINLLQNSLHAAGNTELQILLKAERSGDYIRFTFKDNGKGISDSIIEHIFDPFFTTKDEGTGLGLSVSKKIIENYQGTLDVQSDMHGTSFIINMPFLVQKKKTGKKME
ncbi:two-component system sensor histidine kinase NtrB [Cytobacillus sp. NCCP-133]|uniref:two-component system sensor histidine kinase NtrB n=1 Tax=Cytobacillus sp. NCCP-133 TaxID=766848 RepID=UPI00222E05B8|nr:ATP-binding protein [Cytobacillus sp. NCCP-133]GLB61100.1 PAS domain-containing sensor histidine kinase [Cytobacillus sp. NCCP-133]